MAGLFPVAPDPEALRQVPAAPPPGSQIGLDWGFDFERGDMPLDRNGQVTTVSGALVSAQESIATLFTERAAYRMFSRRHGIDYDRAQAKSLRRAIHASLETQIRDRLRRVPGVRDVVAFAWLDHADQVDGTFTIVTEIGARQQMHVAIPA